MASSSSTIAAPSYSLNAALDHRTVEPPVPKARAWASSYPSQSSPMLSKDEKATSSATLPLLNLAQGVPGHPPHPNLLKAMAASSKENIMETHGYGPVFGDESLRKSLANDLNLRYKGKILAEEVAITSGGNLAAAVTFHALASPGDAIVLPTPWYFKYVWEAYDHSMKVSLIQLLLRSTIQSRNDIDVFVNQRLAIGNNTSGICPQL
jgi:aspartate/methionine/tyrosine aminotransferase